MNTVIALASITLVGQGNIPNNKESSCRREMLILIRSRNALWNLIGPSHTLSLRRRNEVGLDTWCCIFNFYGNHRMYVLLSPLNSRGTWNTEVALLLMSEVGFSRGPEVMLHLCIGRHEWCKRKIPGPCRNKCVSNSSVTFISQTWEALLWSRHQCSHGEANHSLLGDLEGFSGRRP